MIGKYGSRPPAGVFAATGEQPVAVQGLEVCILADVYDQLVSFIARCPREISGYCKVRETDAGYLITDIIVPSQDSSAVETTMGAADNAAFLEEVIARKEQPRDWNCWWHSHVGMPAQFSGQDLGTARQGLPGAAWLLSIVGNKAQEFSVRLDIYKPRWVGIANLPLRIVFGANAAVLAAASEIIASKVRLPVPPPPYKVKKKPRGLTQRIFGVFTDGGEDADEEENEAGNGNPVQTPSPAPSAAAMQLARSAIASYGEYQALPDKDKENTIELWKKELAGLMRRHGITRREVVTAIPSVDFPASSGREEETEDRRIERFVIKISVWTQVSHLPKIESDDVRLLLLALQAARWIAKSKQEPAPSAAPAPVVPAAPAPPQSAGDPPADVSIDDFGTMTEEDKIQAVRIWHAELHRLARQRLISASGIAGYLPGEPEEVRSLAGFLLDGSKSGEVTTAYAHDLYQALIGVRFIASGKQPTASSDTTLEQWQALAPVYRAAVIRAWCAELERIMKESSLSARQIAGKFGWDIENLLKRSPWESTRLPILGELTVEQFYGFLKKAREMANDRSAAAPAEPALTASAANGEGVKS